MKRIKSASEGKRNFQEQEAEYDARMKAEDKLTWKHPGNKELVLKYITECKKGKIKSNGQNKRIQKNSLYRILGLLKLFSEEWLDKDFATSTAEDWEDFYDRMEENEIVQADRTKKGQGKKKPYSYNTKAKNYKTVKKFARWIGKEDYTSDWVTVEETPTKEYLTRSEVERLVAGVTLKMRATIMVLFDGGFRAEEFANLRWVDIKKPEGKDYYQAFVRKETTKGQLGKKKERKVSLWLATDYLDAYKHSVKTQRKRAGETFSENEYLYQGTYQSLRKGLLRIGDRILGRHVNPHMMRHSSATYYANIVKTYQQFCSRYGWNLNSPVAQRYFHGVADDEIAAATKDHEIARFKTEFEQTKLLNQQLASQVASMREEMSELETGFEKWMENPRLAEVIMATVMAAGRAKK